MSIWSVERDEMARKGGPHTAVGPYGAMSDACQAAKCDPFCKLFGGYTVTRDQQTGAFEYHYRGSVHLGMFERVLLEMVWDADRYICGGM